MIGRPYRKMLYTAVAAATIAFFTACSGGASSIAPRPTTPQGAASVQRFVLHYACPASGALEYVSDLNNRVVNVYAGTFAGQGPCGQITDGLISPARVFVQTSTHDLYVADFSGAYVQVYHRGQTTPYNTYKDPSVQDVEDVAVAPDGTIIATNFRKRNRTERGSISTWVGGPNGGTFVGNFPMMISKFGFDVTVNKNGTVYFSEETKHQGGALWKVRCPAGVCGAQTRIVGVQFEFPGGMQFDTTGDLVAGDQAGLIDTFELPNPNPKTFPVAGQPVDIALSGADRHIFVADESDDLAAEYSYPGGKLIGTVPGMPRGGLDGIAFDP